MKKVLTLGFLLLGLEQLSAQTLPFCSPDVLCNNPDFTKDAKALCETYFNVQRYELSKTWELYDTHKRLRCISDKNIKDYTALKDCLERDHLDQ